ncbi:MAG TPA: MbnH family di-heme enzyme [Roseiflexaceae bacterium]|nr:MbnH family di-heme enzyme [Roseiflexaceae bacterium]
MQLYAARSWVVFLIVLSSACGSRGTPYEWRLPPGFPPPAVPQDNPLTVEKIELGRRLFYDARLSANGTQSCASCHRQSLAFTDGVATATGSTGQKHSRNSMSLTNAAYNATFTWAHSGIDSIERHILIPLFGDAPVEMGAAGHEAEILARIEGDARYRQLFAAAYPYRLNRIDFDNVAKAIACYVRTLISFDSSFDRYAYYGDDSALTEAQIRGMNLFMSERLECSHCHNGFNFSQFATHESTAVQDRAFHITGLHNAGKQHVAGFDYGLFNVTGVPADKDKFKAPTLRNVERTAPYMHDGSIATLEEVIDFYAAGGRPHPHKSPFIKGFTLTKEEKSNLIEFLRSLTDETFLSNPQLAPPQ